MKCFVITTGKGDTWVTYARSSNSALAQFQVKFPGSVVASIVEAEQF